MKNKVSFAGVGLIGVSTVLAVVSAILYNMSYAKDGATQVLLIIAAAVGALSLVLAFVMGKEFPNMLVIAHAVLAMAAIAVSIAPMVNEIGLVYAGLDPVTNLNGYIVFAAFAAVTWLLALLGSFVGVGKRAAQ